MKRENIFDAFEYADPVMVHMAEHRTFPRHTWQKGLTVAAVLMLVIGTGLWTIHHHSVLQPVPPPVTEEPTEPLIEEPETTPIEPTPEEPSMPSDQELLGLVVKLEQGVTDFTFEMPLELSSEQLFDAYLLLAEPGDKDDGFDKGRKDYVFAEASVELVLGRYFKKFSFDAAEVSGFDAERGGIVRQDDQGFGGDLIGEVTEKSLEGSLLQFTVLYCREDGTPERCKRYEMEWFPGGYYYLSAKERCQTLRNETEEYSISVEEAERILTAFSVDTMIEEPGGTESFCPYEIMIGTSTYCLTEDLSCVEGFLRLPDGEYRNFIKETTDDERLLLKQVISNHEQP